MPLYDFKCKDCNESCEILVISSAGDAPVCPACGSENLEKLMAAHSSMSGSAKPAFPGPGDTGCCGSSPGQKEGCAGPGSCCGRTF
ncbi:MAG: zinc ribbon domain-containing protein [Desulfobacter sp.]|nr:MAG: zinc ribbon domain-containing protein [Desulfobacter sp.]